MTAQKRDERLQDVPLSITALNERHLQDLGVSSLREYANFVPGLVYSGTAFLGERSGPDITIRGVSNSRLFDFETSIATATTGFVYGEVPAYSFDPNIMDVERIEVLKGPQGTLYGAGSMGGTVKVVPNKPDATEFSGLAEGGGSVTSDGSNNYKVGAMVNAPLIPDVLALRFSAYAHENSGFIDARLVQGLPTETRGRDAVVSTINTNQNTNSGNDFLENIDRDELFGGRAALRFTPNDKFDATLAYFFQSKSTDSLRNFEPVLSAGSNEHVTELYQLQPESTEYQLASLEMSYDFGAATLYSISGWLNRDYAGATDFAVITYGALGGDGTVPVPGTAPVTFGVDTDVLSEELRLQGTIESLGWDGSGLDWVVGYFYQSEDRHSIGSVSVSPEWLTDAQSPVNPPPSGTQTVWAGDYQSDYTNNSFFADLTLRLSQRWSISAGARRSSQELDSSRVDFGNVFAGASTPTGSTFDDRKVTEKRTTPRATVSFRPSGEVTMYTSASEGFRIGGGNNVSNFSTPGCQAALAALGISDIGEFESDSIVNYEVGVKTSLAGGRVQANLSAYNVDWSDLQASVSLSNFSSTCGASIVSNVGEARIRGLETEIRALLTDRLQLSFTGQYADAEITEAAPGTAASAGDPLKNIPEFSGALGLQYSFDLPAGYGGSLRGDYSYVGKRSFSDVAAGVNPAFNLPEYDLLNLRAVVTRDDWEYAAYMSNVLNEVPELGVTTLPGGPGRYEGAYAPGVQRFVTTSQPRTVGIEVRRRF